VQVKYIQPFVDSTLKVFKEFLNVDINAGQPFLFNHNNNDCSYDISGIIGIAGHTLGIVAVSFPKLLALDLASRMTGETIKIFDDTVIDLVGEIVNIIAGNAKQGLEQYQLVISLPSIVKGVNHQIVGVTGVPLIGIPFSAPKGTLYLFVSLKDLITA
jgi:chemotaxis protein CheX